MQKLSNTKLISLVSKLLVLLLVAKVISLAVWWYLPSEGVELNAKKSYQSKYQRVSFYNMLNTEKVEALQTQTVTKQAYSINNLILKGLYGSRFNGFAIIAKKSSQNDTTIVEVGESYEGYKLKEIELNGVIFTKGSKEYRLSLEQADAQLSKAITKVEQSAEETSQKEVSRKDIQTYSNNPALIWKDIGIQEMRKGKSLEGFRVTRVRPGSKMATLGLQKGDVITKANNVPLSSLNDVFKLYKQIDKIKTLALTIQRNNQEKEIIYEIR
jgi:type II secretion system protein C